MYELWWADRWDLIGQYEEVGDALRAVRRMKRIYGSPPPMMLCHIASGSHLPSKRAIYEGKELLRKAEDAWEEERLVAEYDRQDVGNNYIPSRKIRNIDPFALGQPSNPLHNGDVPRRHG